MLVIVIINACCTMISINKYKINFLIYFTILIGYYCGTLDLHKITTKIDSQIPHIAHQPFGKGVNQV